MIRTYRTQATGVLALPVAQLRERLASGVLSAETLVEECIARITGSEAEIRAWAWFDADHAIAQARELDARRRSGAAIGALHGLPVALKDIIDTAGIPTENGTSQDKGRVPLRDAFVARRLRASGAIIVGKTVTTELAFMDPGKTRNPHDPGHTPGGSSQGSAAAVAAGMVPLAVGTQTAGSVIRPASFCGVTGFKPTFGAIPRTGVLRQSPTLDTIGVFAADPTGAAIVAEALFGYDDADPATRPAPHPYLYDIASSDPLRPPIFAFMRPPGWDNAEPELHSAFRELVAALGDQVFEIPAPPGFTAAASDRRCINLAEMARHFRGYAQDRTNALGPSVRAAIAEGHSITDRDYLAAQTSGSALNASLEDIFQRCDAILCPAATGAAPKGLHSTGDPIFNAVWTLCGTPAVAIPVLGNERGLPMGVQLVGRRNDDGRLLRVAEWLFRWADLQNAQALE